MCIYIYIYISTARPAALVRRPWGPACTEQPEEVIQHIYIYIYANTCIYLSTYLSLSLYIYIYTYVYICISLSLYIYIYIYMYTHTLIRWNRNPRPQLEPQITSLDKCKIHQVLSETPISIICCLFSTKV